MRSSRNLKRGGMACEFNNICAFRNCLDLNDLREIESVGNQFTWRNNRVEGFIEEKLDRVVGNLAWRSHFTLAIADNISWDGSDHCPIVLHLRGFSDDVDVDVREDTRIFRFEARWVHHNDFDVNMRNFWRSAKQKHMGQWNKVVEECGIQLKKWNKDVYLTSQNRLGWLLHRLKQVRKMTPLPSVIEEYRNVEKEIRNLRQQETAAWQWCRPFVLRDGNKNTAYFHSKVSNRRRRNRLKWLEDRNGVKHKSPDGMKTVVSLTTLLSYFVRRDRSSPWMMWVSLNTGLLRIWQPF